MGGRVGIQGEQLSDCLHDILTSPFSLQLPLVFPFSVQASPCPTASDSGIHLHIISIPHVPSMSNEYPRRFSLRGAAKDVNEAQMDND